MRRPCRAARRRRRCASLGISRRRVAWDHRGRGAGLRSQRAPASPQPCPRAQSWSRPRHRRRLGAGAHPRLAQRCALGHRADRKAVVATGLPSSDPAAGCGLTLVLLILWWSHPRVPARCAGRRSCRRRAEIRDLASNRGPPARGSASGCGLALFGVDLGCCRSRRLRPASWPSASPFDGRAAGLKRALASLGPVPRAPRRRSCDPPGRSWAELAGLPADGARRGGAVGAAEPPRHCSGPAVVDLEQSSRSHSANSGSRRPGWPRWWPRLCRRTGGMHTAAAAPGHASATIRVSRLPGPDGVVVAGIG